MNMDEDVFDAVRRWWRACIRKDLGAAEVPSGHPLSEASRLLGTGRLLEEDLVITDWNLFDPVTRPLPGMVLCSYSFRISGKRGRRNFFFRGRATDVLSKENDRWTHLFHHGVLEPLPSPRLTGRDAGLDD